MREFGAQPVVAHPAAFLVDFLPVIRRRITRTGFVIDHVHNESNPTKAEDSGSLYLQGNRSLSYWR